MGQSKSAKQHSLGGPKDGTDIGEGGTCANLHNANCNTWDFLFTCQKCNFV